MSSLRTAGLTYLSPSQIATLTLCERRWYHGLKDPPTEAMATGAGLAAALEHDNLALGLAAYRAQRPQPDGFTDPEVDAQAILVAIATITHAFDGYRERWPDPPSTIREQTYLVQRDGRLLQVRVDGVVPGEYLIEDKLRSGGSMKPEKIENEIRQGTQLTAEVYAHRAVTGEHLPVKLRCVKKCDPRKLKGDDAGDVIREHFQGDVFFEYEVVRTSVQLNRFARELGDLHERANEVANADLGGARNTDACHAYNRPCPALGICQGQGSADNQEDHVHAAA